MLEQVRCPHFRNGVKAGAIRIKRTLRARTALAHCEAWQPFPALNQIDGRARMSGVTKDVLIRPGRNRLMPPFEIRGGVRRPRATGRTGPKAHRTGGPEYPAPTICGDHLAGLICVSSSLLRRIAASVAGFPSRSSRRLRASIAEAFPALALISNQAKASSSFLGTPFPSE